jgi:hypothetical protein
MSTRAWGQRLLLTKEGGRVSLAGTRAAELIMERLDRNIRLSGVANNAAFRATRSRQSDFVLALWRTRRAQTGWRGRTKPIPYIFRRRRAKLRLIGGVLPFLRRSRQCLPGLRHDGRHPNGDAAAARITCTLVVMSNFVFRRRSIQKPSSYTAAFAFL